MSSESTRVISFRYSRRKLVGAALGCALFVGCGLFIALSDEFDHRRLAQPAGWAAVAFFGAGMLALVFRLYNRKAVFHVSPEGILDVRLSPSWIPWSAIRGIAVARVRSQKFIMLDVDPDQWRRNAMTFMARWTTPANKWLGLSGIAITPAGLEGSPHEVSEAIRRFCPIEFCDVLRDF